MFTTNKRHTKGIELQDTVNVIIKNSFFSFTGDTAAYLLKSTEGGHFFEFRDNVVDGWLNKGVTGNDQFAFFQNLDFLKFNNNRIVNIGSENFFIETLNGGQFEFIGNYIDLDSLQRSSLGLSATGNIYGRGNVLKRGGVEFNVRPALGSVKLNSDTYIDSLRVSAGVGDTLFISPNYDTYYHQNADSGQVTQIRFNVTIAGWENAEVTFFAIDSLWFADSGNITPDSTTARTTVGDKATFIYNSKLGKWKEK